MKSFMQSCCIVCISAITLLLAGCGSSKVATEAVSGTVTLDGKPLSGASVAFSPKVAGEGLAGVATTDEKGFYVLQTPLGAVNAGTAKGEYTVMIRKFETKPTGKKIKDDYGDSQDETESVSVLPDIYNDPAKTPLAASVQAGKNVYNFDLETK